MDQNGHIHHLSDDEMEELKQFFERERKMVSLSNDAIKVLQELVDFAKGIK